MDAGQRNYNFWLQLMLFPVSLQSFFLISFFLLCRKKDPYIAINELLLYLYNYQICRHHLVEHDWTEGAKREGTFVLDNANDSPSPAAIRSSAPAMRTPSATTNGLRSRIPSANNGHRRSPDPSLAHTNGSNGLEAEEITLAIARVEEAVSPLARASTQIRDSLSLLEKNLAQLKTASARSMESSMIE